ncbi:MAG: nucleotidyl transferase AbiEii/AbiGii toxin family protein [Candidatus Wallbacteria bacterium]|nr:nucleotidyl transferase AbiEii/AbiGii toxin family protein [Candidatus Wallbacteria bacterium]
MNANDVRYLIVGGFALSFHAQPRFTKDLDFFIDSSPDNCEKLIKALADFGFSELDLAAEDFSAPDKVVQLGIAPVRIDILTSIDGVGFSEAWEQKIEGRYDTEKAWFISREMLLRNKLASGRTRDLADAELLR